MGLMQKLFGSKLATSPGVDSSVHKIDKHKALAATNSQVPNPQNVDFTSVRSAPVVTQPTYFDIRTAGALEALAQEREAMAKSSTQAYRSLRRVDRADTQVHRVHRKYQTDLAQNEVSKLKANTRLAEKLHELRPEYERMGQRIETADNAAAAAIDSIKRSYGG